MSTIDHRKSNYDPLVPSCFYDSHNLEIMAELAHEFYSQVEEYYARHSEEKRELYHPKEWVKLGDEARRQTRNQIRTVPERIEKVDLRID